jgi:8-oxo-dGTP pyrophosphatase MutT (NUDIX family)
MKLLREIKDKDFDKVSGWKLRGASRAVLFDSKGLVPLLFVSKHNYYKLPGGGIDKGEDKSEALGREVKEEVGSEIEVTGEVGRIIEYRSEFHLKQTSYCYVGKILSKGHPNFEEGELNEGFKLVWIPLDTAISLVKDSKPDNYEGTFIQKRDLAFLTFVKQMTKPQQ